MVYYAIVGPGVKGVFRDWKRVEELSSLIPYCSYRKFYDEQSAWNFATSKYIPKYAGYLNKYGDTFDSPYLILRYIIYKEYVYYTIDVTHFGRVVVEAPNVQTQYIANHVLIKKKHESVLNADDIYTNALAVVEGVELFGHWIDVDIVIPNHSVFYALTVYSGTDKRFLNLQERLNSRMARVSYTMEVKRIGKYKPSSVANASGRKIDGREAEGKLG